MDNLTQQRNVLTQMKSCEYYTPKWYIDKVKKVLLLIDLDPASCSLAQKTVQAGTYYTEADDGLTLTWRGNVFLNPPYNKNGKRVPLAPKWTRYAVDQFHLGHINSIIMLVNAKLGYKWLTDLIDYRHAITVIHKERMAFLTPEDISKGSNGTKSRQPQATILLSKQREVIERFYDEFGDTGWVPNHGPFW